MSGFTDAAKNAIQNAIKRATSLGAPATMYFGLLKCSHGARANSTAYASNNTITITIGGIITLYRCTTAGTTAASQPGGYVGARAEAITDGTAVFTEQSDQLDAENALSMIEPSAGSYARVALTAGTGAFAAAADGVTTQTAAVVFPTPSADYHGAAERIWGVGIWSASTAGTCWEWAPLSALQQVLNGQAAPQIAAAAFTSRVGA